ncbi:hypothetical protein A1O7_01190 [Cladophialophora yegresii CBS 114405]|uniref:Cytochrome P450 n=1 Tax=Cladophialophora yegresii CBS 114405 TaxID=1182544 RepID=W9WJT6_9EURO|nr:uncharacterized protein A1O7_01190 [Cladophialophora yegresii CBS 114405]EXJ64851.1 hypothetical protein A1O7_01190 [Cladophialophora yegresii CBS 114405]
MSEGRVFERVQDLVQNLDSIHTVLLLVCLWMTWQVLLYLYRLTLHPLAKFPGPKLAAASYWYEYYYDVSKEGRFIWKIMKLHEQYGPVVRINPNELHFNDPDFYEEIYHGKKHKTDRDKWFNLDHIGQGLAFTIDHDLHARRRNALSPYFSMQSIRALEPRITDVVAIMLDRIQEAYQDGRTINLYHLFTAFAMDIVSEYALGKDLSMHFMTHPDFGKQWAELTVAIRINNFGRHFKGIMAVLVSVPEFIMVKLNPRIGGFIDFHNILRKKVQQVLDEQGSEKSKDEPTTLFRELIKSDLPAEEKTLRRLTDEASMVLGAGGETTAQALVRTFYHLLENPHVVNRLRAELTAAMPEPNKIPSLATLQNLPYLNAVVDEGVRIAFPVPARSPRVFHDHTLHYDKWTIQPGTAVSMSPWMVMMSDKIFPDPFKFDPERWLGNKELRKYQVAFSKGRRACLGINLAYAEMLFAIALIIRNFELELFETTWEDVEIVHDFFVALPRFDRNGVRVKVKKELS